MAHICQGYNEEAVPRRQGARLRNEHSELFPNLYTSVKWFNVKSSVREFYRKVIAFKAKLKNDKAYEYSDDLFDGLEFSQDDISGEDSQRFMRHYFSGLLKTVQNLITETIRCMS